MRRQLDGFGGDVNPQRVAAEQFSRDQRCAAARERVEHQVARRRDQTDDAFEEEDWFLRRIAYPFLRFRIEKRNVPNIGDGHALLVAVVDDLAVFIAGIDGFAMLVALSALENLINIRRGRIVVEKLVVLVSVGLAVKENGLVRRHRIALRVRPTAIVPDDFRAEHRLAKNLIQQTADVMRGAGVAVEEQRAGRFQDASEFLHANAQELDVLRARLPLVAELELGRAVASDERMRLLREERRVNIDHVHRLGSQTARHFQAIAMTNFTCHVVPSFLRPGP